jgi:hypothetical protein
MLGYTKGMPYRRFGGTRVNTSHQPPHQQSAVGLVQVECTAGQWTIYGELLLLYRAGDAIVKIENTIWYVPEGAWKRVKAPTAV